MIRDLLNPGIGMLELREDHRGVNVVGLKEVETISVEEVHSNVLFFCLCVYCMLCLLVFCLCARVCLCSCVSACTCVCVCVCVCPCVQNSQHFEFV